MGASRELSELASLVSVSSGNVGIGTSSPVAKLDVSGTIKSGGSSVGFITMEAGSSTNTGYGGFYNAAGTRQGYIGFGDTTFGINLASDAGSSMPLRFVVTGTEQARITTAGDFQFNSGYGSVATAYGCRAWANWNGTLSSPITPRASGNVGSITKSATGIYQVNFTNNMPDANYSVSAIGSRATTATTNNVATQVVDGTLSVSSFQVFNERSNDGAQVDANMCVAVFR